MSVEFPAEAARYSSTWPRRDSSAAAELRIALLASFTADPLVPHLGMPLLDVGLVPEIRIGPFNQIAQQCLREDGEIARFAPDVLIVCARPEDRPASGAAGPEDDAASGDPAVMERLASTALATAHRWGALLIWVLPPLTAESPLGTADGQDSLGIAARTVAARENVRARLALNEHACVVDLEEIVRTVGVRRAYHPGLFRLARVPFVEEVFFHLGGELARMVALRHGQGCHGVLVDIDDLLLDRPEPPGQDEVDELAGLLGRLPESRRLGYRTARSEHAARRALAERAPALAGIGADWIAAGGSASGELETFTEPAGISTATVAVLTGQRWDVEGPETTPVRIVRCGRSLEQARRGLVQAGAFDTVPVVSSGGDDVAADAASEAATVEDYAPVDYETFLQSLQVAAEVSEKHGDCVDAEQNVADRAHDFTLAISRPASEFANTPGKQLLSASITDRYGDYGISAVIGVSTKDKEWVVEMFSVSCVVLGKGVEEILLDDLVHRAAELGVPRLAFCYRDTGRNRDAVEFLRQVAADRGSTVEAVHITATDIGERPETTEELGGADD